VKQLQLFGREIEANQWRQGLLKRLKEEGETELHDRLAECGKTFPLWCKGCNHRHDASTKCSRKWCPSCGPKRANERAARMRFAFRRMKWPMQLTLTVPNVAEGWEDPQLLRRLLHSFKKLRDRRIWKENVAGGIFSVEVTDKGNGLHPHLHALVDCRWLAMKTPAPAPRDDRETLSAKFRCAAEEFTSHWRDVIGDERTRNVWIRRCDVGAVDEVLKYAIKSEDALNCTGRIGPILRLLDSVRTVERLGNLRAIKWPEDDEHKLECACGGTEWTPQPPAGERPPRVDAREVHRQKREAELDAILDRIVEEERLREV
jgi:hypothetical protein